MAYSPESGKFLLAEELYESNSFEIRCQQPDCRKDPAGAGFKKDSGGNKDVQGRSRRLWRCRRKTCRKTVPCTEFIKIAKSALTGPAFKRVLDSVCARLGTESFEGKVLACLGSEDSKQAGPVPGSPSLVRKRKSAPELDEDTIRVAQRPPSRRPRLSAPTGGSPPWNDADIPSPARDFTFKPFADARAASADDRIPSGPPRPPPSPTIEPTPPPPRREARPASPEVPPTPVPPQGGISRTAATPCKVEGAAELLPPLRVGRARDEVEDSEDAAAGSVQISSVFSRFEEAHDAACLHIAQPDLWSCIETAHAVFGNALAVRTQLESSGFLRKCWKANAESSVPLPHAPPPSSAGEVSSPPSLPLRRVCDRAPTPGPRLAAADLARKFIDTSCPKRKKPIRDEAKAKGDGFLKQFNKHIHAHKRSLALVRGCP